MLFRRCYSGKIFETAKVTSINSVINSTRYQRGYNIIAFLRNVVNCSDLYTSAAPFLSAVFDY